ncbi:MAG: cobalamin-dependent protein [Firmicutes bacterium]|nr:cobalamin-dependent protein [Bacillota bacterium]
MKEVVLAKEVNRVDYIDEKLSDDFTNALLSVNRVEASRIIESYFAVAKSFAAIERIIGQALEKIGNGWEDGTVSLSQVYMSGVIAEEITDSYLPKLQIKRKAKPRLAIVVLQDHHSLGKKIVSSIVRANGFHLIDFGAGLHADEIVKLAIENEIDVLLISTLMLTSAMKVKDIKDELEKRESKIRIIVGGAPFRLDSSLWRKVGADADGKNASHIIETISQVV